jgi:hypothetical protein
LQCWFRRRSGAMRRLLLVTSVLCAIDTTQAFAQHEVSQQLLELEHVPAQLNRWISQGPVDERVYRH